MSTPLDIIKEYIKLLIRDYELEEDVLLKVWTDSHPKTMSRKNSIVSIAELVKPVVNEEALKKLKRDDLIKLCKDKGLKTTGVKTVLIDRLLGKEESKKSPKKEKKLADVLQKILHNNNTINIRRNIFNNYEHLDTHFIFDDVTQAVIGKQLDDGNIAMLTDKDIELCKEYNFIYTIPDTIFTENPYDDVMM